MLEVSHRGRKASSCACPVAEPAAASSSSSLTYADGLGFQHSGAEVAAPVGGVLEQCGFKLGHSVAHRAIAGRTGFHAVGQVQKLCHNGVAQQGTENNKPVEPGVPFTKLHHQTLLLTGPLRRFAPASPVRGAGQADGEVFTRLYTQRRPSARACSIIFIFRLIHFTNRRLTKARFIV